MKKSTLLVLLLAASMFFAACSRKTNRTTKVTVAGEATSKVEPDAAVLTLSVVTQSRQATAAQQENARKSDAVTNSVKSIAGTNVEIRTSDYSLQPQYDYRDGRQTIKGYDARNSIIVTLSDLKKVGEVIDSASQAGANSIDGVAFILRQTSPARGLALSDATRQAMNKAQSIAQALGGHVARVVEENEASTVSGSDVDMVEKAYTLNGLLDRQATTPITSGRLRVKSNVQLIVEIEG